jgi:hypothetical protein
MYKILTIILITISIACESSQMFYHGYVYNSFCPLKNVRVKEDTDKSNSTFTDSSGYFT